MSVEEEGYRQGHKGEGCQIEPTIEPNTPRFTVCLIYGDYRPRNLAGFWNSKGLSL